MSFWKALAISVLAAAAGSAATITFEMNGTFTGVQPPGTPPWMKAVIESVDGDTVKMTLTADGLPVGSKIDKWAFNLNPLLAPASLIFANWGGGGVSQPAVTQAADGSNIQSSHGYDLLFDFVNSGAGRFSPGDSMNVEVSLSGGLAPEDFLFMNGGSQDMSQTAAHVLALPSGRCVDDEPGSACTSGSVYGSSVVPEDENPSEVPEPSTWMMMASGAGLCALSRLRRR